MDSNDIISWSCLEATLAQIFQSFQSTYSIPDMFRLIQTSVACQGVFEYPSQFLSAEKRCRNWFAIWMAMVSLGIAVAQVHDGDKEDTLVPKWYSTFVQHTDEALLAGIRQQLGQFNPLFSRAGVFLNMCSSEEQPTVDFFVSLNIPVWYPWGPTKNHTHTQESQLLGEIHASSRDVTACSLFFDRRARACAVSYTKFGGRQSAMGPLLQKSCPTC